MRVPQLGRGSRVLIAGGVATAVLAVAGLAAAVTRSDDSTTTSPEGRSTDQGSPTSTPTGDGDPSASGLPSESMTAGPPLPLPSASPDVSSTPGATPQASATSGATPQASATTRPSTAAPVPTSTPRPSTTPSTAARPTITVSKTSGLSPAGQTVTVTGRGFNAQKGVYVAFCVKPPAGQAPSPCGGGADTSGSSNGSVWVSSNPPPYGADLAVPYGPGGTFTVQITVSALIGDVDCRTTRCVVATRNDHTRSSDRSQDVLVPITFA